MATGKILPLTLPAPGGFGINKQEGASILDIRWASDLINTIIDQEGRVGARRGWTAVTTSPLSGTPDIEQTHEFIDDVGAVEQISAADNKLFTGTTVLTDITGTITGITANNWQFANLNGNVIGFQQNHEPVIYKGTGNFTPLQAELADWVPTFAYTTGDVAKSLSGVNPTLYFEVTTTGTSGGSEPAWDTTPGQTTSDGTVTWTTRRFPNGNAVLAAFGRIWVLDTTATILHFSDLLIPQAFAGGTSGTIDLKTVWPEGMDSATSVDEFNKRLIIFGKRSILIFRNPDIPSTISLEDSVTKIGSIARDSAAAIGSDIIFLADSGVRSLSRTIVDGSAPLGDISRNVRDFLKTFVDTENVDKIRAVYHEPEGFYLLNFPTVGRTFAFNTKIFNPDSSVKVTTWRGINPRAMSSALDGTLFLGQAGVLAKYEGFTDNGSSYDLIFRTSWTDLNEIAADLGPRTKIPKKMKVFLLDGLGYTVNVKWAFDYSGAFITEPSVVKTNATLAQWGISQWGIDEWSGGDVFSTIQTQMSSHGVVIRLGFDVTINGTNISFQKIDMLTKIGNIPVAINC